MKIFLLSEVFQGYTYVMFDSSCRICLTAPLLVYTRSAIIWGSDFDLFQHFKFLAVKVDRDVRDLQPLLDRKKSFVPSETRDRTFHWTNFFFISQRICVDVLIDFWVSRDLVNTMQQYPIKPRLEIKCGVSRTIKNNYIPIPRSLYGCTRRDEQSRYLISTPSSLFKSQYVFFIDL